MTDTIQICGTDVSTMTYKDQRVITLGMMDKVHQRPEGTARRNFNQNRKHFREEEDFFEIDQADEIRRMGFFRPQGGVAAKIVLITESGYLLLVKSFTDDLAWEVQRSMQKTYFAAQKPMAQTPPMPMLASPAMEGLLKPAVKKVLRYFRLGLTSTEISRVALIPGRTVRRYVQILIEAGYVAPTTEQLAVRQRARNLGKKHLTLVEG